MRPASIGTIDRALDDRKNCHPGRVAGAVSCLGTLRNGGGCRQSSGAAGAVCLPRDSADEGRQADFCQHRGMGVGELSCGPHSGGRLGAELGEVFNPLAGLSEREFVAVRGPHPSVDSDLQLRDAAALIDSCRGREPIEPSDRVEFIELGAYLALRHFQDTSRDCRNLGGSVVALVITATDAVGDLDKGDGLLVGTH